MLTFLLTHHFQTLPLTMLLTDHPSLTPSQFLLFRLRELYAADILMSGFHPCEAVYVRICSRGHVYSRMSTLTRWISPYMQILILVHKKTSKFKRSVWPACLSVCPSVPHFLGKKHQSLYIHIGRRSPTCCGPEVPEGSAAEDREDPSYPNIHIIDELMMIIASF